MVTFTKEYTVDTDHLEDAERALAATGLFGGMFVRHGCLSYTVLKDNQERGCYVVTHSWADQAAFTRAQEMAAQESYDFQQRSRIWLKAVRALDAFEREAPGRYAVLSEHPARRRS